MSDRSVDSVAVIGAGLSGLVAAHELVKQDIDVHLFESSSRVGGRIGSTDLDGVVVPTAADAFLARQSQMIDLARELGLGDDLIEPAARDARIVRDGTLYPLPPNLLGIPTEVDALSGLVSPAGISRAKQDLTQPDDRPDGDESVGALVRRRLGDEVLEYVVDPLLGGINAGDSDRLSVESGALQIGAARQLGASLIEGARSVRTQSQFDPDAPVFVSHRDGVGAIIDALASSVADHASLHLDVYASLRKFDQRWRVGTADVDRVVVATEAYSAADLLGAVAPEASAHLRSIDYSSVALTLLMLPEASVPLPGNVSGVLVPRKEGFLTTAVSVATNKWPQLTGDGRQVLRVSVGRRDDRRFDRLDDDALAGTILGELTALIGLNADPLAVEVVRWPRSLPQYDVGHGQMIKAMESTLSDEAPGVALAGAYLRGLGLPACVQSGRDAADRSVRTVTP